MRIVPMHISRSGAQTYHHVPGPCVGVLCWHGATSLGLVAEGYARLRYQTTNPPYWRTQANNLLPRILKEFGGGGGGALATDENGFWTIYVPGPMARRVSEVIKDLYQAEPDWNGLFEAGVARMDGSWKDPPDWTEAEPLGAGCWVGEQFPSPKDPGRLRCKFSVGGYDFIVPPGEYQCDGEIHPCDAPFDPGRWLPAELREVPQFATVPYPCPECWSPWLTERIEKLRASGYKGYADAMDSAYSSKFAVASLAEPLQMRAPWPAPDAR